MSDAVWVALITVVLGAASGAIGTYVSKRLSRGHDQAIVDDLVTARMSRELERVYKRVDELEADVLELRQDRERADARAENSDRDAKLARTDADHARQMAAQFLAHIERLEGMVPPPPPPRPWLSESAA